MTDDPGPMPNGPSSNGLTGDATITDDIVLTGFYSKDIRFPVIVSRRPQFATNTRQTSLQDEGSDAMNGAVDFANAYVVLQTNSKHEGHGVVSPIADQFEELGLMINLVDFYNWPWQ